MIIIKKDRTAAISQADRHIGFENDNLVEARYFKIDNTELKEYSFKLELQNTLDIVDLEIETKTDEYVILKWNVTAASIGKGGIIKAQIRAFDDGYNHVWHSEIMEFIAEESVNATQSIDDERILSEIEQLEVKFRTVESHTTRYDNPHRLTSTQLESGEDNTFLGEGNFTSGTENVAGTRGFRILGYSGIIDDRGAYIIDATKEDFDVVQALLDAGETLYWSLNNDMHLDHMGTIYSTEWDSHSFGVCSFYANRGKTGELQRYSADITYVKNGSPYDYAPELGYSIQNATETNFPSIVICDHPTLGTHDLFDSAVCFGNQNIAQGENSFVQGYGNKAYGNYSSIHGKNNSAGYDTHILGRQNYAPKAQDTFVGGFANSVYEFVNGAAVVGGYNRANRSFQFVAGQMNNNKKNNLFEIGNGDYINGTRHNAFEVDINGIVYANETPLPFQKLCDITVDFSSNNNLLPNLQDTSVIKLEQWKLNEATDIPNMVFFGGIRLQPGAGLDPQKKYVMCVEITVNSAKNTEELAKVSVNGVENSSWKGIVSRGLKIGKNHLMYMFNPPSDTDSTTYGIYFQAPTNAGVYLNATLDNVKVFELQKENTDYYQYSFAVCSDTNKKIPVLSMTKGHNGYYGVVTQYDVENDGYAVLVADGGVYAPTLSSEKENTKVSLFTGSQVIDMFLT